MCIMLCGQLLLSVLYVCAREITVEFSFVRALWIRDTKSEAPRWIVGSDVGSLLLALKLMSVPFHESHDNYIATCEPVT